MKYKELLDAPGCERIKDFYNVGPVQRANVESFYDAIIAHLSKGVSVEPLYYTTFTADAQIIHNPYYTIEQLKTAIAAARVRALEEAAKAIEVLSDERVLDWADCADAIRALIGETK